MSYSYQCSSEGCIDYCCTVQKGMFLQFCEACNKLRYLSFSTGICLIYVTEL